MSTEPASKILYPGVARLWPELTDKEVAARMNALIVRRGNLGPWTDGQVATWRRGHASCPDYARLALAAALGVSFADLSLAHAVTV